MDEKRLSFFLLFNFIFTPVNAITSDALVTDLVFLDIDIDGKEVGTIIIGLFGATTPKTVQNFISLSTEEVFNIIIIINIIIMHIFYVLVTVWIRLPWFHISPDNTKLYDARCIHTYLLYNIKFTVHNSCECFYISIHVYKIMYNIYNYIHIICMCVCLMFNIVYTDVFLQL